MTIDPQKLDKLQTLIDKVCDGSANVSDFGNLEELMRGDTEAQRFYLHNIDLINTLRWQTTGDATHHSMSALRNISDPSQKNKQRNSRPRWRRAFVAMCAAALAAAAVFAAIYYRPQPNPIHKTVPVCEAAEVKGEVWIKDLNGDARKLTADTHIQSGDQITLQGKDASVDLKLKNGSTLELRDFAVVRVEEKGRRFHLKKGRIQAAIIPQQVAGTVTVATPHTEVRTSDARFSVIAAGHRAELSVDEGQASVVRISDQQSIVVASGQSVVARETGDLVARTSSDPPVYWSVAFENGLPAGWTQGKIVKSGLPPGSKGAVQTTRSDKRRASGKHVYLIVSNRDHEQGLFRIPEKAELQFTFKMDRPGPFQVMLISAAPQGKAPRPIVLDSMHRARAIGLLGSHLGPLLFWSAFFEEFAENGQVFVLHGDRPSDGTKLCSVKAGKWYLASAPLAGFCGLQQSKQAPTVGAKAAVLLFNTGDIDRGLTIDRIVIKGGGRTAYEIRPLR